MKFYRWFDYYKWDLLIVTSGISFVIYIIAY